MIEYWVKRISSSLIFKTSFLDGNQDLQIPIRNKVMVDSL